MTREPQIVLFLTHVYDTKKYLKKLFDKCYRRNFPQLSNDVGSFFEIFHFHLQNLFYIPFLAKNILGTLQKYPLLRKKWSAFDLEGKKNIKNTLFEITCFVLFEGKNENFEKTAYAIRKLRKKYVDNDYQTILLSTF